MSVAAVWGRSLFHGDRVGVRDREGRMASPQAGRFAQDTVAAVRARPRAGERRLALSIVLAALTVVAASLVLVWVRLQAVHTGYQLSAARHLAHRLEQEQRELELEIATLTSPRRLERVARERLGMGPPAPGQIVSVP
jgi:cell division protein FtsL